MRPFEACPFCNGEFMFDWINDTRRCNNCGALFTWRIIREPSGVPIDLTLQLKKAEDRIAELEMKIRHNALWQASEDAEERAHLEKLVLRIAELERDFDMLFRSTTNKQSRKNTQTQTFVYGKGSKPLPCPLCGNIVDDKESR